MLVYPTSFPMWSTREGHLSIHDDKMAAELGFPYSHELLAEVILNSATMKDSYAKYAEEAAALGKTLD
jgi:hypothetical protein